EPEPMVSAEIRWAPDLTCFRSSMSERSKRSMVSEYSPCCLEVLEEVENNFTYRMTAVILFLCFKLPASATQHFFSKVSAFNPFSLKECGFIWRQRMAFIFRMTAGIHSSIEALATD